MPLINALSQEFSELEKLSGLTELIELSVVSNPVSVTKCIALSFIDLPLCPGVSQTTTQVSVDLSSPIAAFIGRDHGHSRRETCCSNDVWLCS